MCLAILKQCRTWSANAWDNAVETAGPEYPGGSVARATRLRELADECLSDYDAAIQCVREQCAGWYGDARTHLLSAEALEALGGDASDARTASEALDEYASECDAQV